MTLEIEKISNGYIVRRKVGYSWIVHFCKTIDEVKDYIGKNIREDAF